MLDMKKLSLLLACLLIAFVAARVDSQTARDTSPDSRLSKYATVDYDPLPEPLTAAEIAERKIRNKRYDVSLMVLSNPHGETAMVGGSDVEPDVLPIPTADSRLILIGTINSAKAFLSNEKKGIYTEFSVEVEKVLKQDGQGRVTTDNVVTLDRAGGVIRYSTGQKVLYMISGYDHPEKGGRYVFFLTGDDPENTNYKILTAYRLTRGKAIPVDPVNNREPYNAKTEAEFLKLVSKKSISQPDR